MFNLEFKSGTRRVVVLIGRYAIKLPKPTSFVSFLCGLMENLVERSWYCSDFCIHSGTVFDDTPLAKVHYANRYGFLLVMSRVDQVCSENDRAEIDEVNKVLCKYGADTDDKPENYGYIGDRLVKIDYGFFGVNNDIGCPARMRTKNGERVDTLLYKILGRRFY